MGGERGMGITECLIMVLRPEREVPAAVPVARLLPLRPAIYVSWARLLRRAGLVSGRGRLPLSASNKYTAMIFLPAFSSR